jgi:hypothetical protein
MHITLGDPSKLKSTTTIADIFNIKKIRDGIFDLFINKAIAQNSTCSNLSLMDTTDQVNWKTVDLTTSSSTTPCIQKIQSAGEYTILSVSNIYDSNGSECDLVLIKNANGNTSCFYISLPNRSTSGRPVLFLDPANGQTSGQLTLNGKYFFIGFNTDSNPNSAYSGFLRIDLTGSTPTMSVIYALYGTSQTNNTLSINGKNIFFSPYYGLANGDLIVNTFELTGSPNAVPQIGIKRSYYVLSNPALTDPTQAVAILFNKTTTSQTDGYSIDLTSSPLGTWVKQNVASDATKVWFNDDAFSAPRALGGHTFMLNIGTDSTTYQPCGSIQNILIKASVDSNNNITFSNLGGSLLGNGLGNNTYTNNITPSADGSKLFSLQWKVVDATHIQVVKYSKNTSNDSCINPENITGGNIEVPSSVTNGKNAGELVSIFTFRTANSLYLQNFNYNPQDPNPARGCVSSLGCPMQDSSMMLHFDLTTSAITNVPLTKFKNTRYYLKSEYSSSTSSFLYFNFIDTAQSPVLNIASELDSSGFKNTIKFPVEVEVVNPVISGEATYFDTSGGGGGGGGDGGGGGGGGGAGAGDLLIRISSLINKPLYLTRD